jgi:hypothetical protein
VTGRQPGLDRSSPSAPAPSRPFALSTRVVIPGVPPAWPNERLGPMARHSRMKEWKAFTWTLAHSARNAAHWPLPVRCDPPALRWVRFDLYRRRLLDADNAVASIKPILDGLHWPGNHPGGVGPLLVDDSAAWCALLQVEQHTVELGGQERVVVTVWLVDPRQPA